MVSDTVWWISRLEAWSKQSGIEYPIVLSEDLLSDMKSIVTVASNASSTDGFGYYSGWLHRCLVFRTLCEEVGGDYGFTSSHAVLITSALLSK